MNSPCQREKKEAEMISSESMRLLQRGKKGIWYLETGRGKAVSLRTSDRDEAISRVRVHLLRQTSNVEWLGEKVQITVGEWADQWLKLGELNKSHDTVRREQQIFSTVLPLLGASTALSGLQAGHLEEIKRILRQQMSDITVNLYVRILKSWINSAVKHGHLTKNPWQYVSQLRTQKRPPAFATADQVGKIMASITNDDHRKVVALYLYTGARRSEIAALEWKDIGENSITFPHTKSRASKVIPLLPQLREALGPRGIGRVVKLTREYIGRIVERYVHAYGLRPHDLSHTYASHRAMNGVDLYTIGSLLGHSNVQTTQIYAHLSSSHLENAAAKLPY
jgi:site-specific recombinase XerD